MYDFTQRVFVQVAAAAMLRYGQVRSSKYGCHATTILCRDLCKQHYSGVSPAHCDRGRIIFFPVFVKIHDQVCELHRFCRFWNAEDGKRQQTQKLDRIHSQVKVDDNVT